MQLRLLAMIVSLTDSSRRIQDLEEICLDMHRTPWSHRRITFPSPCGHIRDYKHRGLEVASLAERSIQL
jgi:hypothetical protein